MTKYTRDENGRFAKASKIVNGRLYAYKGSVVRAKKLCKNNARLVSVHKKLSGLVKDEDLKPISKKLVKSYLKKA